MSARRSLSSLTRAAREPLLVEDSYGGHPVTPEPLTRYFIRQLQRLEPRSVFSCEGHEQRPPNEVGAVNIPHAFYITFEAEPYCAKAIIDCSQGCTLELTPAVDSEVEAEIFIWALRVYEPTAQAKRRHLDRLARTWDAAFGSLWGAE